MSSNLPIFLNKTKICIICEGFEEYEYIEKLKLLEVWDKSYEIITVNAEGIGNIPARYQDKYQNGAYEVVYVFCDTDKTPFKSYDEIKVKIDNLHGIDGAANKVVIFGNPCTMQIIILHWVDIILDSHRKDKNAPIIQKYVGIENYDAKKSQRELLFEKIEIDNYILMKQRVAKLSSSDTKVGSSNFNCLIENLSRSDKSWIHELNAFLV